MASAGALWRGRVPWGGASPAGPYAGDGPDRHAGDRSRPDVGAFPARRGLCSNWSTTSQLPQFAMLRRGGFRT